MSRRRVKRRQPLPEARPRRESRADGEWYVRSVTGSAATKVYRCPGCDHQIRPATPHLVVWPVDKPILSESALDERRHWHTACWTRRP